MRTGYVASVRREKDGLRSGLLSLAYGVRAIAVVLGFALLVASAFIGPAWLRNAGLLMAVAGCGAMVIWFPDAFGLDPVRRRNERKRPPR